MLNLTGIIRYSQNQWDDSDEASSEQQRDLGVIGQVDKRVTRKTGTNMQPFLRFPHER